MFREQEISVSLLLRTTWVFLSWYAWPMLTILSSLGFWFMVPRKADMNRIRVFDKIF